MSPAAPQHTRRIVMTGRKFAEYATVHQRIDNNPAAAVTAAGLPEWKPQVKHERFPKPDADLIRKQQIEDELGERA